jgi:hypothetical protein
MTASRFFIIPLLLLVGGAGIRAEIIKPVLRIALPPPLDISALPWQAWQDGYTTLPDGSFRCDNGENAKQQRGVGKNVVLNQEVPSPIVVKAKSRAKAVSGSPDRDYSLYLDIHYMDGTPLWGQSTPFQIGSHDWEEQQVIVVPDKPIQRVDCWLLMRSHSGQADFKDLEFYQLTRPDGCTVFDGVPVGDGKRQQGFILRDAAADTDFVSFRQGQAHGVRISSQADTRHGAHSIQAEISDDSGRDRILHLVYSLPLPQGDWQWLSMTRHADGQGKEPQQQEYLESVMIPCGSSGRYSRYPLAAVSDGKQGRAIAMDLFHPAVARVAYNRRSNELFVAWDIALTAEKNHAKIALSFFDFDPAWGFRSALDALYRVYPEAFVVRVKRQGLWMPFAKISQIPDWEDFGFAIKEGNDECVWDDEHGILTFRYTEPMTWWMRMPDEMPRELPAALSEVQRLAAEGHRTARSFASSVFHNQLGQEPARWRDTPWCKGAVWSMASLPDIDDPHSHFRCAWTPEIIQRFYGPERKGDLDGEYIDSSEGYVTDTLNYRRDHFAATNAPLTYSMHGQQPVIFRGLIAWDYIRAIAKDVHGMGKLMMANSTPGNLWWLAPMLDVLGSESNWNHNNNWRPPSDSALLFRRALCGAKPYCFLQNSNFDHFDSDKVEKYMRRCLFYGMYPGFFSADASTKHYFRNPELYNRDRPLFRKYVPLCRLAGEAGWQPITLARSDNPQLWLERFGDRFLTVFNATSEQQEARIASGIGAQSAYEHVKQKEQPGQRTNGEGYVFNISLDPEEVALIELRP